ncbi:MAG: sugar ABC transporter permease [Clostridia bacterium]|nr:sugar ABC transporter permease [Clostridia bacterium]
MNKQGNIEVEGIIIKLKKMWWIKINTKAFRTSTLDGATFPYIITVEYTVNDTTYEKNKFVYLGDKEINIGDKLKVVCDVINPKKIVIHK